MHISDEERDAVYKTIYSRRDVRGQFTGEPIETDVISRVLTAAHHAPSVGFMQPWDFILVKDRDTRTKIKSAFEKATTEAAEMFEGERREKYKSFKLEGILESSMGICVTCDRSRTGPVVIGRTHQPEMDLYSSVCAVQNLWLAARAENLGVGWVSIVDHDAVKSILNIAEHITPIAYLCIGPVSHFKPKPELEAAGWLPRMDVETVTHYEQMELKEI